MAGRVSDPTRSRIGFPDHRLRLDARTFPHSALAVGAAPSFPDPAEAGRSQRQVILKNLRHNQEFAWCERMLDRLELPPTVHHHSHHRVWQRLKREEDSREAGLYAEQSGRAPSRGEAGKLVPPSGIELEVLLHGGQLGSGNGSDAVVAGSKIRQSCESPRRRIIEFDAIAEAS
jgi:hypothetical protein